MIARPATTPTVAPAITPALDLWDDEVAESGEVDVDGEMDGLPEALELVGLSSTLREELERLIRETKTAYT